MNIPSPAAVASARTARLAREATTPVYSTSTPPAPVREHIMAVETDGIWGRHWSVMKESEVEAFFADMDDQFAKWESSGSIPAHEPDGLSDVDHSAKCWCQK